MIHWRLLALNNKLYLHLYSPFATVPLEQERAEVNNEAVGSVGSPWCLRLLVFTILQGRPAAIYTPHLIDEASRLQKASMASPRSHSSN